MTVHAPHELLAMLMELCDGSRSWSDVVASLGKRWPVDTVTAFMSRLVMEAVLVEAGELWARWSEVAQLPQQHATVATEAKIAALPARAQSRLLPGEGLWAEAVRSRKNALAVTLDKRESFRTFTDEALSQEALCSILWAAHGVTRAPATAGVPWHRTSGSGGNMHSARWFVAVLRALPLEAHGGTALPPGVYEARFHQLGGVSLKRVPGHAQDAWRCLRDPRVLRYASALLLPVYDIAIPAQKYGNRATLFALIEAGQCLQNAQLMATSLGAASVLRGDTSAEETLALAGLDRRGAACWVPVPGMVVGARPSVDQRARQAADDHLRVSRSMQAPGSGGFAFAAFAPAPQLAGSGRAASAPEAMTKAEAEAWERLGWATPSRVFEARVTELESPLQPQHIVAYSPRQYASGGFAFKPFVARRAYLWGEALDTESGRSHAVLADCLHALDSLPSKHRRYAYTNASTSGVAAGIRFEDALMRATLELIERDAFVCSWLTGAAPACVEPDSLPREAQRRIAGLRSEGLDITVLDLANAWCPVLAVFGQSHSLPFTAITAAAAFSPEHALRKALDEAEGRFGHARHFPAAQPGDNAMRAIERYYRDARTYRRSDFFAQAALSTRFRSVGRGCAHNWDALQSRLRAEGLRLYAADITPQGAAADQGRTPLHIVRAFVPGLVPIWFHRGTQPQGMPKFNRSASARGGRPGGHFFHPFT
ncbi:hypothetical protein GCM10027034_16330 [Ramlibacter solisilvae]